MIQRPAHLTDDNASRFKDQGLVDLYHHRLPYPQETFQILLGLIREMPRTVLDVGTGIGDLARPLAHYVDHVDAIDFSAAMIAQGQLLFGGDSPNLRWIAGRVDDVALDIQYSLIMGGDSIHWMDWEVIFPKFAQHLAPNGVIALVGRSEKAADWQDGLMHLIRTYSVYRNFQPYDLVETLQQAGYFEVMGEQYTAYATTEQSVEEYIASFHSRGSLSPDAMPPEHIAEFDRTLRELVMPYSEHGMLSLQTRARITWGRPV